MVMELDKPMNWCPVEKHEHFDCKDKLDFWFYFYFVPHANND